MKTKYILGFIVMAIFSIPAFAQGGADGLLMPKFIKPSDNSTSILLKDLSKERRFLREIPAGLRNKSAEGYCLPQVQKY